MRYFILFLLLDTHNTMSYVYLLLCSDGATYVGATVDLDQRLRKHNKEIKGGAFATGAKVLKGETWVRACHVEGFPNWQAALQFEWKWKQISRKLSSSLLPLERRMKALTQLLALERPTSKAIPYTEWPTPPQVNIEIEEALKYYQPTTNTM
jgi:structure-specific endonuclease subunit SLX1